MQIEFIYIPTIIFLYFYAVFKGGYQNGNI